MRCTTGGIVAPGQKGDVCDRLAVGKARIVRRQSQDLSQVGIALVETGELPGFEDHLFDGAA